MDFDPGSITRSDMDNLADAIENYLDILESVIVIPKEIYKEIGKPMEKSIDITKQLIKKLRKGDKSVFKDDDDYESLL